MSPPIPSRAVPSAGCHAIVPLSLFEAMRRLDAPVADALDEVHGELTAKRFGLNRTVATEIVRLERLARRDASVSADELQALIRLVARRPDAALVFSDGGRRAARRAVTRLPGAVRALRRTLPVALGRRLVARSADRMLGLAVRWDGTVPVAEFHAGRQRDPGAACAFFGAALAELLRQLIVFHGAMLHVSCRARGDAACVWRAASPHD
ncbi:MAG: hypothetical protein OER21_07740 [Gemmatimonadota bacterium]|nr:hypothetical protein [Gemmatimonadota bacterium]